MEKCFLLAFISFVLYHIHPRPGIGFRILSISICKCQQSRLPWRIRQLPGIIPGLSTDFAFVCLDRKTLAKVILGRIFFFIVVPKQVRETSSRYHLPFCRLAIHSGGHNDAYQSSDAPPKIENTFFHKAFL